MAAMRNDARPIGPETDDQSPLSEEHSRTVVNRERDDDRDSVSGPRYRDHRVDMGPTSEPTLPADDSTLNTKI
jgi:hypothetical protein